MDATKWTQGFQEMINVKPMEQIMIPNTTTQPPCTTTTRPNPNANPNANANAAVAGERKARPAEKLNCPRCNSTNTKFCYYNNYSLTQPRYFCKGCRRYWTEGGSLRNVPVGGSSRKNKRSSSSTSASTKLPDLNPPILFSGQILTPKSTTTTTSTSPQHKDLNLLSFPVMQDNNMAAQFLHMPKMENSASQPYNNIVSTSSTTTTTSTSHRHVSALELLRTGVSSRGFNAFMMPMMMDHNNNSNLCFGSNNNHLSFASSAAEFGGGNGNNENRTTSSCHESVMNGRVLFPFGEMKEMSTTTTTTHHDQNEEERSTHQGNISNTSNASYWSGMFSTTGGPSW